MSKQQAGDAFSRSLFEHFQTLWQWLYHKPNGGNQKLTNLYMVGGDGKQKLMASKAQIWVSMSRLLKLSMESKSQEFLQEHFWPMGTLSNNILERLFKTCMHSSCVSCMSYLACQFCLCPSIWWLLFSSLFSLLCPARATQSSDCDPRSNDEKHHTSSNDSSDEHILAINGNLCCGFEQQLSRRKREVCTYMNARENRWITLKMEYITRPSILPNMCSLIWVVRISSIKATCKIISGSIKWPMKLFLQTCPETPNGQWQQFARRQRWQWNSRILPILLGNSPLASIHECAGIQWTASPLTSFTLKIPI